MNDDWQVLPLSEVADVVMGQSPPGDTYNTAGDGLPFMQGSAEFGVHTPRPVKWCSAPTRVAEPGDLLVSVRAPVGDTNFAHLRLAYGRGLAAVRGNGRALTRYLRLAIQARVSAMLAQSSGGMFTSITAAGLRGFEVPIPPLPVQRRTVDLMGHLDTHLANLQTERDALSACVTAHRAAEWTRLAHLTRPLNDLLKGITAGRSPNTTGERPSCSEDGVLKVNSVDPSGSFLPDEAKVLAADHGLSQDWELRGGEVLVTRANTAERVAAVARVPLDVRSGLFLCDKTLRLDIDEAVANPDFVVQMLLTPQARSQIAEMATGVGSSMVNLSQVKIRSWRLPLPPLDEQGEVAKGIQALVSVRDAVDLELLTSRGVRRALLSGVFSGEVEIPVPYDELLGAV